MSFPYFSISQRFLQSFDEVIHIILSQTEWRKQAQDVRAGTTGEAMLLVNQTSTHFLMGHCQINTNHQSAPTHILDNRVIFL